ncbi:MAG TPA: protein kinase, partial [Gemmataceae bacterium]|nr:protein kinase [Gemmataceae bacterium]
MDESQVFTHAVKLATPAEQARYLDQACAGNPELRAGVEALLRAHAGHPNFLEQPASLPEETVARGVTAQSSAGLPGLVLAGRYKLLEVIGEGGMGTVWMAQQTEPVKRLVAIKLIKAGLGSKTVLARFEAERQALALMDHPNIAKVLDAGTAPDGSPFFAMDLVKGIPITRYSDEHRLTPRERLELFVPVCEAVQHAHQKGIIHRDLKPSNVLVAQYDDRPVPKVIDFGVAKATGQALTEESLYTGFGAVVGTVEYMSPEQASFNQLDVDTRSDIYSLGVLLYELLTGSPPFSRHELERAGMLQMLRVIREQEPTRPSAKLSTAEGLPTLAANRGTEPKRLTALVRGELDWIALKALEKERSRRYGTASALAADVQHYLADEPVQACPPSAWYSFRKFVRRHRVAMLASVLVCSAIVLGAGGIAWAAWDRAARQARIADNVDQFLERADQLYRAGRLSEALAEAEKARGLLDAGADNPQFRDQVHQWLADLAMATRLDESQLAPSDTNFNAFHATAYLQAFRDYGIDLKSMAPAEAAARIAASRIQADLVTALDDWSIRILEDPDPATQAFRRRLHDIVQIADSDPWRQSCRRAADARDRQRLRALAASANLVGACPASLAALGAYLRTTGDLKHAIAFLRAAQRMHPANVSIMLELSTCLQRLRPIRWDDALGFQRAILAARPSSPAAHVQLGRTLDMMRRADEAIGSFREALRLKPDYVPAHYCLGDLLLYRKHDPQGALAEFSQGLAVAPDNVPVRLRRANAYVELGQREKALADLAQCIKLQPNRALAWWSRGHVLLRLGQPAKALADFAQAIQLEPGCLQAWTGRASAYLALKQYAQAIAACSETIKFKPDNGPA